MGRGGEQVARAEGGAGVYIMKTLSKKTLFQKIISCIEPQADSVLVTDANPGNPLVLTITHRSETRVYSIYVWNITHGGKNRSDDEYRIQVTGLEHFSPPVGAYSYPVPIILGYYAPNDIFAGYDSRSHDKALGKSPSMQVSLKAMLSANQAGIAVHEKPNETVIALRPMFLLDYMWNEAALHSEGAKSIIDFSSQTDKSVRDLSAVSLDVTARQYKVISAKKAIRDATFRARVLEAYSHMCAMCSVQLNIVEAAHILPVSNSESNDETNNGIALCPNHHKSYDRSLIAFDNDFRIILNNEKIKELKAKSRDGGVDRIIHESRDLIRVPSNPGLQPSKQFIHKANISRGWN